MNAYENCVLLHIQLAAAGRVGGKPVTSNARTERCTAVGDGRECCHLVLAEKHYLLEGKTGSWQERILDHIILKSLMLKIVQK